MDEKRILLSTPEYVAAIREAIFLLRWWPSDRPEEWPLERSIYTDRSAITVTKLAKLLEWLDLPAAELVDDPALRRRIMKREAKRRQAARMRGLDVPKREPGWKAKPFWAFVDKSNPDPDGCWVWIGSRMRRGYGAYTDPLTRKRHGAHVWSWQLANNQVRPAGMCIMHKCDNRACVRPDHLQLGTNQENHDDKVRKGRQARGEMNASARLTADQVQEIRRSNPTDGHQRVALAKRYGVSLASIHNILKGQTWKHLLTDPSDQPQVSP